VRYHPCRLLKRHLVGNCPVGSRCSHYSRDRRDPQVADCLLTRYGHTQLALREHQVLAVAEVAVSPFLQGHLVWVLGETGRPVIALKRRCVAGLTAAVPLLRRP